MQIYVTRDQKQFGPYSSDDVKAHLSQGMLSLADLAWFEGASEWMPLGSIPGISASPPPPPPPPPPPLASLPAGSLPTNVLEELKKYPKRTQNTCLVCGYHGLLGVGASVLSPGSKRLALCARIAAVIIVILVMLWSFFVGYFSSIWGDIVFVVIVLSLWNFGDMRTKNFLHCPNCKTKLGPVKL